MVGPICDYPQNLGIIFLRLSHYIIVLLFNGLTEMSIFDDPVLSWSWSVYINLGGLEALGG